MPLGAGREGRRGPLYNTPQRRAGEKLAVGRKKRCRKRTLSSRSRAGGHRRHTSRSFRISFTVVFYMLNLQLDRDDSLSLRISGGIHQPLLTSLLPKLVKPGNTVIDVGAHIGYFTLQFSELAGEKGTIVALEPTPVTFRILRDNCAGRKNILLSQTAASDKTSVAQLYLCKDNIGDNHLWQEGERNWLAVQTVKLDDALAHFDKIDLLKIDTQGWEGFVLEGCVDRVLPATRKIVLEFWPTGLTRAGYEPVKLLRLLEAYGFILYEIDEINNRLTTASIPHLLETFKVKQDASTQNIKSGDFTDILAIGKGESFELSGLPKR